MKPEQQTDAPQSTDMSTVQQPVEDFTVPRAEPGPHLQGVLSVVLFAGLGSLLLRRIARSNSVGNLQRWMPVLHASLWSLAVIIITMIYARGLPSGWFLGIWLLFLVMAFASVGWLRSVLAGVALSIEGRIRIGDSIRLGETSGEVLAFGVRSVRIRGADGALHEIPNEKLVTESVANLTGERGDSPCELSVSVPDSIDAADALEIARSVAVLSPLASPRHRPEVFLLSRSGDEQHWIQVRGYSFDAQYQDHFRSDVVSRLQAAFAKIAGENVPTSKVNASDELLVED